MLSESFSLCFFLEGERFADYGRAWPRYEQTFVHNLLLHLKCGEIDPQYVPAHGLGAVPSAAPPRTSRSRNRRAHP